MRVLGPSLPLRIASPVLGFAGLAQIASFALSNTLADQITTLIFGVGLLVVAWRMRRLSVHVTETDVVVNRLFTTDRLPVEDARLIRRMTSTMSMMWGGSLFDGHFPAGAEKLDNTVGARTLLIGSKKLGKKAFVSCCFGLSPAKYLKAQNDLTAAIEEARLLGTVIAG